MPETEIHHSETDTTIKPSEDEPSIDRTVGQLEARTAQLEKDILDGAGRLTNVEGYTQTIPQELEKLWTATSALPKSEDVQSLLDRLGKLEETVVNTPPQLVPPSTEQPVIQKPSNEKKERGGLHGVLHRLFS